MDQEETRLPQENLFNETASTSRCDEYAANKFDFSEDSSSSSSTVSDNSPISPDEITQKAQKMSRKEKKKDEMLQLALQAITTFKASQKRASKTHTAGTVKKRSSQRNAHHQYTKQEPPCSGDDSDQLETTKTQGTDWATEKPPLKRLTWQEPAAFVHPLLRQILTPVQLSPPKKDFSILPLRPPVDQPQVGPDLSYYEEGSSDEEYNPDELCGESVLKCQMCSQMFPTQALADEHMAGQSHLSALRLMTLTILNYCNDIDLIVQLREKMENRRSRSGTNQEKQNASGPGSAPPGQMNSESEDEKELQRLENSYALAGHSASDPSLAQSSLDLDPVDIYPAVKVQKRKRRRKRKPAAAVQT